MTGGIAAELQKLFLACSASFTDSRCSMMNVAVIIAVAIAAARRINMVISLHQSS